MKTFWPYKYLPAFVFVTNFFVMPNAGSTTYGPFIFLRPRCTFPNISKEEAEGLVAHELVHTKQSYRTCFINGILYLCSKKWRLKYEVEAYCEQLKYVPQDLEIFAGYLATRYRLNITKEEAIVALKAGSGV